MKRLKFTLLSTLLTAASMWCAPTASAAGVDDFQLGADISGVTEMEAHGRFQKNRDGETVECTRLMKDLGLNSVRLRVWVNPERGFSSAADVLEMARRAKANDMSLMIDFHYSDWWADPGKQNIPAAWVHCDLQQMCDSLAAHTRTTLQLLKDNDIDVRWVQVGNETPNGFLWPMAQLEKGLGENMPNYAALAQAGYEAVKEVYPEAIVIQHLDDAYDIKQYINFFDGLKENGAKWDMIGVSVYPYWSKRDSDDPTAVTDVIDNLNAIAARYGTDVMIVETGVLCAEPEKGKDFLSRLIKQAKDDTRGRCKGVYYWAPEASNGHYPLGAFDNDMPTAIMDAFTEASK